MATCLFVCSVFVIGTEGWQHVIGSGVFRVWETKYDANAMDVDDVDTDAAANHLDPNNAISDAALPKDLSSKDTVVHVIGRPVAVTVDQFRACERIEDGTARDVPPKSGGDPCAHRSP